MEKNIQSLKKYNSKFLNYNDEKWCYGRVGLAHVKKRKFHYPFWNYAKEDNIRFIKCICINCNKRFNPKDNLYTPLIIPVTQINNYSSYEIVIVLNGKALPIEGELIRKNTLGWINQRMILDSTIDFLNKS